MDVFMLVLMIATQMSTLAGVEIFNVLPDDSTTGSCPSQPCATLSQYLLDNNGTLPVVSNVEYHFLPGEHYLHSKLILEHLKNFSFLGVTSDSSSLPQLVYCSRLSQRHLTIAYSNHVQVYNIIFKYFNTFDPDNSM